MQLYKEAKLSLRETKIYRLLDYRVWLLTQVIISVVKAPVNVLCQKHNFFFWKCIYLFIYLLVMEHREGRNFWFRYSTCAAVLQPLTHSDVAPSQQWRQLNTAVPTWCWLLIKREVHTAARKSFHSAAYCSSKLDD